MYSVAPTFDFSSHAVQNSEVNVSSMSVLLRLAPSGVAVAKEGHGGRGPKLQT